MPIKNNGLITIYDTIENIMAKDINNKFLNYPYIEGQTFYAEDTNIFLEDKNRQRLVKTTFNAIEVMEDGAENFYERGFAGFEGNVILVKSKGFFKLQYVDISGVLHDLTYSDHEMESILTTSSLNGYSSVVLSFYAYAPYNKLDSTIMIDDPRISGNYNFRTGVKNITIENFSTTGWTDDISKLKGEWAYDSSEDEYYLVIPGFYEYRIPSGYEPKLVTSRVLLFDRNEYYTFTDLNGDEASIYRENLNQTPIYLYKAFNDFQDEGSLTLPEYLIYNFKKAEFEGGSDLNGWSILPPAIDETNNRVIYLIGTIAVSGSDISVIQTIDWGTPKLHNKIPENSTTYWMIRSSNIIELSKEGVFIPNSITFSSKRKVGLNEIEDFGAYFVLEYTTDNTNWTETYASENAENSITYNMELSTVKAIRAKLYKEYDSINYSILLDEETIPVLVEASNTPTLNIGNDNVSIAAAWAGFNNLVFSSSTVEMFIGTESLIYDTNLTTSKTYKIGLNYTNITGNYSVLNNIVTITPETMSADTANILVTVTYRDEKGAQQIITGGINYSLNRQGIKGDTGPQGPRGASGAGSRSIKLTPSQYVISYAADGITESDIILFSTEIQNVEGTATYRFLVDGIEKRAQSSTTSFTLADGDEPGPGDSIVVKVELYEYAVLCASDSVSIYGVKDGFNAITGFLTNEAHVVPTNSAGSGFNLSTAGGAFIIYDGDNNVTSEATFSGSTVKNGLTMTISNALGTKGIYSLSGASWSSNSETFTLQAVYGTVTIIKTYTISKSKQGTQGPEGPEGPEGLRGDVGPGIIYQGNYQGGVYYLYDSIRRDVVSVSVSGSAVYYAVKNMGSVINVTPPNTTYWEQMTTFKSVATDILLANNATITKGLVMGTSAENGFIRSYGMNSPTSGTGFYLNGLDGKFTFGNTNGSRVEWDGSNLNVYTSPYSIELNEEAKTIIAKNHTKSAVVVYYKVWTTIEPSTYTTGSTIAANSSIVISNSAWKPPFRYYVKVRFGTSGPIYQDRFLNISDNHYFGVNDVYASISGGTLQTISATFIPVLTNNHIERYVVYINGIATISSSTGTCTLTLMRSVGDLVVVASPFLDDSSGSGGDFAYGYGYEAAQSTAVIKLTKDYTGTSNSNKIAFIITGYYTGGL